MVSESSWDLWVMAPPCFPLCIFSDLISIED